MGAQTEGSLLQRLEEAAHDRPKLYHATRTVLGVWPQLPPEGEPVARWWSGVDPAGGWDEFLGTHTEVFEGREYERRSRWQQSCFYGDPNWMNEYTCLAAEAVGVLPSDFAFPYDSGGTLHVNRDGWTFFLYRAAAHNPAGFGLDIHGVPPYSAFAFPGLEAVSACTREDREAEEPMLNRFRESFRQGAGRNPGAVYATLRTDVFAASVLGLRYLIENRTRMYGAPDDILTMVSAPVDPQPQSGQSSVSSFEGEGGGGGNVRAQATGRNEERDRWLYERCVAGEPYAAIREELRRRVNEHSGWEELFTDQAVQQASARYAKRHRLPHPPGRKARG